MEYCPSKSKYIHSFHHSSKFQLPKHPNRTTMSSPSASPLLPSKPIINNVTEKIASKVIGYFNKVGVSDSISSSFSVAGSYSNLIHGLLINIDRVESGKISCLLSVKPASANIFGSLHGGAVAAVAEILSIACATTVVPEERNLYLGEMSMSYLSAAPVNTELTVDASVLRSGRNITTVEVEFRFKKTGKPAYTARATFYNMPISSL